MGTISELHTDGYLLGAPYKKGNGPWLRGVVDMEAEGINCQLFTHAYYEEKFGVVIPKGMWSQEMFEDEELIFRTSSAEQEYVHGDIFFFGSKTSDPKNLHPAVFTGVRDESGQPLLRHATWVDRKVSDWPLPRFSDYARYGTLHAVKRLVPELFTVFIQPHL